MKHYSLLVTDGDLPSNVAAKFFMQIHDNELYVSSKGNLCGFNKAVGLRSIETANKFAEYCMKKLSDRYNNDIVINVVEWNYSYNKKVSHALDLDFYEVHHLLRTIA